MIKIVIVGAGYGGIITALNLTKKFGQSGSVLITLIDRHDYQLFASNLYEVATADEEMTTMGQLRKSIALPFEEIFKNTNIKIIKAEVTEVNSDRKTVTAGIKKFEYDYLVLGIGSTSDYFNIEGAEKFSLPLKTLKDALNIRNQIEFALQRHRQDINKKNIRIVVAGGGYTGLEFAAELPGLLDILSWKNQYPRKKIEVTVVEAQNALLPGFSGRMSADAYARLQDLKVRVLLSNPIFRVEEHFVELSTGEKMEYDVLVWTTGVKASAVRFTVPFNTDKKGRIITNQFLQSDKHENIFVLGDGACVINADGKPAPPSAQDAIKQGEYLGYALPLILQNKKPAPYRGKKHGYVVAMGGKWAIVNYGGFYFSGFWAYGFCQLVHFNYFRKVAGWWNAFKYIVFQLEMYSRND
jgi:NADH dehydrogenase